MREIKFRAWDKKEKKMIYDIQKEYDTIAGVRYEGTDDEPGETCFNSYLGDDNYIVQQYTGLKDKNGKEIYCGDIVKIGNIREYPNTPEGKGVIELREPFRLTLIEIGGNYNGDELSTFYLNFSYKELEVIGNIYEHKELLRES